MFVFRKSANQSINRAVSWLYLLHWNGGLKLLQTLNILFENLRHETSLYFLLSNNHVNSILTTKFDFEDEELLAYYISFLKTLSLRLGMISRIVIHESKLTIKYTKIVISLKIVILYTFSSMNTELIFLYSRKHWIFILIANPWYVLLCEHSLSLFIVFASLF